VGIEVPRRRIDSFAAVLWDMDGTLVDTEPYWTVAELALAERYGGRWTPEQSLEVIGFDLIDAARLMREQMGIDPSPEQIVEEMLDSVIDQVEHAVPWREGAVELLASLGEAGVPCALVTMSWTRFVKPILEELPVGTFAAVVTGVTRKGVFVRVAEPPVEGRLERGEQGLDVGDRVNVTLLSTDPEKGFIDFGR